MRRDGPTAGTPPVGALLARARRARRLSQFDLAGEAGVSARHLSFVETGRARPSRELVLRLCDALGVAPRDADAFLLAAGFAPAHRETRLDAPDMAEIRAALRLLLARHDPLPAAAFDARWDLVMANEAYARLVDLFLAAGADQAAGPGPLPRLALLPAPRPNMLRYLCHPAGARRHLLNWPETTQAILQRAMREARHGAGLTGLAGDAARDDGTDRAPPLEEALAYPGIASLMRGAAPRAVLVVPVEMRGPDGGTLRLLSTIATLGTAQDLTLRELRIETFHPVGPA